MDEVRPLTIPLTVLHCQHMTDKSYYRKLSHAVYDCRYHLVFVPKYRYDVLKQEVVRQAVQQVFEWVCDAKEIDIIEGNIRSDHVHLYLSIPPKYPVSDVVKWLKEDSATRAFDQFPHLFKRYWGRHFWARGYFVCTIGITDEIIRRYIQNQEQQEAIKEQHLRQLRLWK